MLGILLSALFAMILGFIWYGPLFGKPWMEMSGITPKKMEEQKKKGMHWTYLLSTLGSLVTAFVLNRVLNALSINTIYSALEISFFLWLGLIAPAMMTTVLYDGKPWKLFFINTGYHLTLLLLMSVILMTV